MRLLFIDRGGKGQPSAQPLRIVGNFGSFCVLSHEGVFIAE